MCFSWFPSFKPALVSQQYLYGSQARHLSYNDFINKELILFSNSDNERSIPSLVDGWYPRVPGTAAGVSCL